MSKSYVYAVESGQYSDYRVHGVFSTEEKAQEALSMFGDSSAWIEKRELDSFPPPALQGLKKWAVRMWMDGEVWDVRPYGFCDFDPPYEPLFNVRQVSSRWAGEGNAGREFVRAAVWAKDEKHAVKITNEFRVQEIANREVGNG